MASGGLIIAGSGIKGLGQMTLETISHIKCADIVYYLASDPVTEGYIHEQNPNAFNLDQYQAVDKSRMESYVQLSEVMLKSMREGKNVIGVFYGHPAMFISPGRRAITIARSEGYSARMLPGISPQDCLIADLLVDPELPSSQIFEASDFLFNNRPITTSGNVFLYQPACVGQLLSVANNTADSNPQFKKLLDRLVKEYGEKHTIVNYVGSTLAIWAPIIQPYAIEELYNPEVQKTITASSTLYIPPKESPGSSLVTTSDLYNQLLAFDQKHILHPPVWSNPALPTPGGYYDRVEQGYVDNLANHQAPPSARLYIGSTGMQNALERIILSPTALEKYLKSPADYVELHQTLSDTEKLALIQRTPGAIYKELWLGDPERGWQPVIL